MSDNIERIGHGIYLAEQAKRRAQYENEHEAAAACGSLEWACAVLNRHEHCSLNTWAVQPDGRVWTGGIWLSGFEALAIARAYEPDPQAEADAKLGATLRRVLAAAPDGLGIEPQGTDMLVYTGDGRATAGGEGMDVAEALERLVGRLESDQ